MASPCLAPIPAASSWRRASALQAAACVAPSSRRNRRRRVDAAIEIDRADQRFADVAEDRRPRAAAGSLPRLADADAGWPSPTSSAATLGAGLVADQRRRAAAPVRPRRPRECLDQHLRTPPSAKHAVAEELEPLVAGASPACRRWHASARSRAASGRRSGGRDAPRAPSIAALPPLLHSTSREHPVPADRPRPLPELPGRRCLPRPRRRSPRRARPGSRTARSRPADSTRLSVELSRLSPIMKKWPLGHLVDLRIVLGAVDVAIERQERDAIRQRLAIAVVADAIVVAPLVRPFRAPPACR